MRAPGLTARPVRFSTLNEGIVDLQRVRRPAVMFGMTKSPVALVTTVRQRRAA